MSVRFCHECGARMTETDKFCFNCGTPAAPAVQPPVVPEAEPAAAVPVFTPDIPIAQPSFREEAPVLPPQPEIPAEPSYIPPAEPSYAAPAEPSYVPAAEPSYVAPEEPVYAPPAEASYVAPQEPVYAPPVEPSYVPPVYPAPAQPDYAYNPPAYPTQVPPQYEPQAAAPQVPAKKSAKQKADPKPRKPLPRRSFLNVFGSVLICILLVALILPTVLLVDLRLTADEDRILGMLERLDLDAIPARDIFIDIDDDRTVLDWACEAMNQNFSSIKSIYFRWNEIKPKALKNFLKDTTVLELTADTAAGMLTDLIEATSKTSLEASDLEDFLQENSEFLEEEFELYLDRYSREEMAQQILTTLKIEEISLDELGADSAFVEIATSALSIVTLALLGILILLLVVLLFLVSRKYIMAGIHDTGLVALIVGILLLVLTGAARLLVTFGAGKNGILYLIGILSGTLLESGLLISACIFGFGVLLLLISGITMSILKKKAAKA